MILKNSVEHRIAALEEKAKPPVISTLLDLIIWESEHKDDPEEAEVELSPELQALVDEAIKEDEQ